MLGSADVLQVLPALARERPAFHSEADFQFALAWKVHQSRPELRVRLETRPRPDVHLDLLVTDPSDGSALAVELKYLTDSWEGEVDGESFRLLRQAAQDIRVYDCVKDIERVESLVAGGFASAGLVLALANDPSYWRAPGHGRATNADAFRLYEGGLLSGTRQWGPSTGAGTSRGRTEPLKLRGDYTLRWQGYSVLDGPRGQLRFLAIDVR